MKQLITNLLDSNQWNNASYKSEPSFKCQKWFEYLTSIFLQNPSEFKINRLEFKYIENKPFYQFLIPFVQKITYDLNKELLPYNKLINAENLLTVLSENICVSILDLTHKTLIYELNKERINNNLKGATKEDRYIYFMENHLTSYFKILEFLSNYPVLARLICECIQNKIYNFTLAIDRLEQDKREIQEIFNVNLSKINNIYQLGDSHKNGATILKFIDSNNNTFIYKPKSLGVDVSFQNLLKWFNKKDTLNKFKPISIIDKNSYGWQEFIDKKSCSNEYEIKRFFQRQGQYLGIFHMINATDFHYENIISCGEHPFFIDLESLFQPNFFENLNDQFAMTKANYILRNSIIRSALLPVLAKDKLYKFDVSGLGARKSQTFETFKIINLNTDIMKMEKKPVTIETSSHLPTIKDDIFYPEYFVEDILDGFKNSYFIIMNNTKELQNLIKDEFNNLKIRIILRSTALYGKFLNASIHPKYLLNSADRERLFNYLSNDTRLEQVLSSECKEMLEHDIPYFESITNSRMIYGKYSKTKDFTTDSPLNLALNKVLEFSNADYFRQVDFIKKSLLVNKSIIEESYNFNQIHLKGLSDDTYLQDYDINIFLNEAVRIADDLYEKSISGKDDSISWISLSMDSYENIQFTVLDGSLYEGIAGICLFYAYLHKLTQKNKYLDISKSCIKTMLHENSIGNLSNISAFMGQGSLLYCLINLYKLWDENWLLEEIKKSILEIKKNISGDEVYDFLGGVAGTLSICIDAYISFDIEEALSTAIACGNHLINNCTIMKKGVGWVNNFENTPPLSGFAHGNAGISYSLFKLYHVTNDSIYLNIALKAIEYENSLYNEEVNNWKDLRNFSSLSISLDPIAWCNGAMGIGLARLLSLDYYDSNVLHTDFNNALKKTINHSFIGVSDCLCHGDLGNIELPLTASIKLKDSKLRDLVYSKAASIINNTEKNQGHWKSGIPGRYETENFMVGMSGIGYQLLRLHDNNIPNILTLEVINN